MWEEPRRTLTQGWSDIKIHLWTGEEGRVSLASPSGGSPRRLPSTLQHTMSPQQ